MRRRRVTKSGGQDAQALGRGRGGFGTKVHTRVSGLGLPTAFVLTPGQAADVTQAEALVAGTAADAVIADKGYDSRAVADAIEATGAEAVIPSRRSRTEPRAIDTDRYKGRNRVERFWAKAKVHRRVAARYEKTARNFLAFPHLVSSMLLLR